MATAVAALTGPGRWARDQTTELRSVHPLPAALSDRRGPSDGSVAEGDALSVDARVPAVERLDPALLRAVRAAATAARADGIDLRIGSGWRSPELQRSLFGRAVERYGSVEEARRFVLPPERSAHVSGEAVDVAPTDAAYWLAQHGAEFGLCQSYANEIWHYERTVEPGAPCPMPRADAAGG